MRFELNGIGKKFERHFVFRDVSASFISGDRVAILGGNGSGKSTLLKVISGSLTSTEGKLNFEWNNKNVDIQNHMRLVSFTGPYTELIEEFSLRETLEFHAKFKSFRNGLTIDQVIELTGLKKVADRPIGKYSSGMRQRVKLAVAILTDTPLLLLDEPTSNLDSKAVEWFKELLKDNLDDRILFVGSNHQAPEIELCTREIDLSV